MHACISTSYTTRVPWLFTTDMTGIACPLRFSSSRMTWHCARYGDKIAMFSCFTENSFTSIFAKWTLRNKMNDLSLDCEIKTKVSLRNVMSCYYASRGAASKRTISPELRRNILTVFCCSFALLFDFSEPSSVVTTSACSVPSTWQKTSGTGPAGQKSTLVGSRLLTE